MRGLGYLLITLGFLGGSYFAVQQDGIEGAAAQRHPLRIRLCELPLVVLLLVRP